MFSKYFASGSWGTWYFRFLGCAREFLSYLQMFVRPSALYLKSLFVATCKFPTFENNIFNRRNLLEAELPGKL